MRAFIHDVLYLASGLSRCLLVIREGAERNSLKTRAFDYCLCFDCVGTKPLIGEGADLCIA